MNRPTAAGLLALLFLFAPPARGDEWLHWRGPKQTGEANATRLPDHFTLDPADPHSNLVWKAPYGCRSTPVILRGKVYVINSDGKGLNEGERVMAFDAATGKVLWEHKFNVFHTDIVSSRVGWASMAADSETGNVYAHGVQGMFWCLDGETGKPVWSHSLTEEYGRITGYGGRIVSPVVDQDLVIVGMINANWGDQARGNNRFVAFDKKTGAVRWWSSPTELNKLTYNSIPVVAEIGGQRLLISGTADGSVTAMQVNTGHRVWQYLFAANAVNSSAVVDGHMVYVTHGQENLDQGVQGRVICLDASQIENGKPKLVWEHVGVKCDLSTPLLHDGKLYVPDDGATLHCFDAKTGKREWKFKYGRVARAAPIWADGKIWVAEVNSKMHILQPGEKGCKQLAAVPFYSGEGTLIESAGSAASVDNRVYFGTEDEFYCVGFRDAAVKNEMKPEHTASKPAASTEPPVTALVVPGDVVLKPGDSATFAVRLYDKNGEFIKETAEGVQWSLPTPPKTPAGLQPPPLAGKLEHGTFTAAAAPPGQQGYVEARVGDLPARARVRVAPQIPYTVDLSKTPVGGLPGGWVYAQGRYVVVERDGKKVIKKIATNPAPPLARTIAYITTPDSTQYMIEADGLATFVNNYLPDFGLVNCRYTMQLQGSKKQLKLLSWDAIPRVDKAVDFVMKPDTWYSMKLVVEQKDKSATIRGKVWPRGTPEPAEWTIEFEDPKPNRSGSAGLYGYALGIDPPKPGAEVFYDNIKITPVKAMK